MQRSQVLVRGPMGPIGQVIPGVALPAVTVTSRDPPCHRLCPEMALRGVKPPADGAPRGQTSPAVSSRFVRRPALS